MNARATILLLLVANSAIAAQKPETWAMPIQERVALRLEHQRTAASRSRVNSTSDPYAPMPRFEINGARTPALFLPNELMSLFLNTFLGSDAARTAARASYRDAIQSYGWQESQFWRDLDRDAGDFYRLLDTSSSGERDKAWEKEVCASRTRTLRRMRTRYARFDEFLYREVAPRHVVASDRLEDSAWLLWLEGGCQ